MSFDYCSTSARQRNFSNRSKTPVQRSKLGANNKNSPSVFKSANEYFESWPFPFFHDQNRIPKDGHWSVWTIPVKQFDTKHVFGTLIELLGTKNEGWARNAYCGLLDLIRHGSESQLLDGMKIGGSYGFRKLFSNSPHESATWDGFAAGLDILEQIFQRTPKLSNLCIDAFAYIVFPISKLYKDREKMSIDRVYGEKIVQNPLHCRVKCSKLIANKPDRSNVSSFRSGSTFKLTSKLGISSHYSPESTFASWLRRLETKIIDDFGKRSRERAVLVNQIKRIIPTYDCDIMVPFPTSHSRSSVKLRQVASQFQPRLSSTVRNSSVLRVRQDPIIQKSPIISSGPPSHITGPVAFLPPSVESFIQESEYIFETPKLILPMRSKSQSTDTELLQQKAESIIQKVFTGSKTKEYQRKLTPFVANVFSNTTQDSSLTMDSPSDFQSLDNRQPAVESEEGKLQSVPMGMAPKRLLNSPTTSVSLIAEKDRITDFAIIEDLEANHSENDTEIGDELDGERIGLLGTIRQAPFREEFSLLVNYSDTLPTLYTVDALSSINSTTRPPDSFESEHKNDESKDHLFHLAKVPSTKQTVKRAINPAYDTPIEWKQVRTNQIPNEMAHQNQLEEASTLLSTAENKLEGSEHLSNPMGGEEQAAEKRIGFNLAIDSIPKRKRSHSDDSGENAPVSSEKASEGENINRTDSTGSDGLEQTTQEVSEPRLLRMASDIAKTTIRKMTEYNESEETECVPNDSKTTEKASKMNKIEQIVSEESKISETDTELIKALSSTFTSKVLKNSIEALRMTGQFSETEYTLRVSENGKKDAAFFANSERTTSKDHVSVKRATQELVRGKVSVDDQLVLSKPAILKRSDASYSHISESGESVYLDKKVKPTELTASNFVELPTDTTREIRTSAFRESNREMRFYALSSTEPKRISWKSSQPDDKESALSGKGRRSSDTLEEVLSPTSEKVSGIQRDFGSRTSTTKDQNRKVLQSMDIIREPKKPQPDSANTSFHSTELVFPAEQDQMQRLSKPEWPKLGLYGPVQHELVKTAETEQLSKENNLQLLDRNENYENLRSLIWSSLQSKSSRERHEKGSIKKAIESATKDESMDVLAEQMKELGVNEFLINEVHPSSSSSRLPAVLPHSSESQPHSLSTQDIPIDHNASHVARFYISVRARTSWEENAMHSSSPIVPLVSTNSIEGAENLALSQ